MLSYLFIKYLIKDTAKEQACQITISVEIPDIKVLESLFIKEHS